MKNISLTILRNWVRSKILFCKTRIILKPVNWFALLMVSPDEFQVVTVNKDNKMSNKYFLNIGEA